MPESHSRKRRRKRSSRGRIREEQIAYRGAQFYRAQLKLLLIPAFVILVILAGGGMPLWAQAAVLIVGGIFGLRRPPSTSPDRNFDWAVIGFLVSACLALLPGFILGHPNWWSSAKELGIELPFTYTAQPLKTLEGLLLLLGCTLWGYLIWSWRVEGDDYRRVLWFLSHTISLLALAVSIGTYYGKTYPLAETSDVFSFFQNRNQTATVLVMGGLISFALAMQGMRKARLNGVFGLINTLIIFTGLAFCESRAGILLFTLGCVIWFFFRLRVSRVNLFFKVGVPIFIICLSLLFIFGQRTLERFNFWSQSSPSQMVDLRLGVYHDAALMAAKHPIGGVGLGNFSGVFPQYRDNSAVFQSIIHAESDWVWVLSEMGIFGLFFLLAGVLFLLSRYIPFGEDRTAPFRAAAAVAFIVFLAHSLVDVPGHRLGTVMLAMVIYRLSAPDRTRQKLPVFGPTWWRIVAAISLLGGIVWLLASTLELPIQSRVARDLVMEESIRQAEAKRPDADALIEKVDDAMAFDTLWWWLYSVRADTRLQQRDDKAALDDFRRARFLEKTSSEVSFFEGSAWLNYSFPQAYAAWRDALNRYDPNKKDLYRKMVEKSVGYPLFQDRLADLTRFDKDFRHYYLMRCPLETFKAGIEIDVMESPVLYGYSDEQKADILERWAREGNALKLLDHLKAHPDVVEDDWFFRAIAYAQNEDYELAVDTIAQRVKPLKIPVANQYAEVSLEEHRRMFISTPTDILRGSELLRRQIAADEIADALRTAEMMFRQENIPPYVYYWKGELHRKLGEYKDAWDVWYAYYKMTQDYDEDVFSRYDISTVGDK